MQLVAHQLSVLIGYFAFVCQMKNRSKDWGN